jgi:chromosome segregation ATPase
MTRKRKVKQNKNQQTEKGLDSTEQKLTVPNTAKKSIQLPENAPVEFEARFNEIEKLMNTYKNKYQKASQELSELKKQLETIRQQKIELQKEYDSLSGELEDKIEENNDLKEDISRLSGEIHEMNHQKQSAVDSEEELKTLKKKVEELSNENKEYIIRSKKLEQENQLLREKNEQLSGKRAQVNALKTGDKGKKLRKQIEALKEENRQLKSEVANIEIHNKDISSQQAAAYQKLEQEFAVLVDVKENLQKRFAEQKHNLLEKQKRIVASEEEIRNLKQQLEKQQAAVNRKQRQNYPRIRARMIADLILPELYDKRLDEELKLVKAPSEEDRESVRKLLETTRAFIDFHERELREILT